MPPAFAALLTLIFILVLLIRESRTEKKVSLALWLPVLWISIAASRFPSQWLNLGAPVTIADGSDGSPIDAAFFATILLAGILVVARRRVVIVRLVQDNPWLAAFCIYGLLSILWSDFPFIASKRWIKTLGHPVMALIILTDPEPLKALRTVVKRCAYLLIPTSILFVKYFPEYGRSFDDWTGQGYFQGVGLTKNGLGHICWLFGIFFIWNLLTTRQLDKRQIRRDELLVSAGFLCMIAWLLTIADSKTSLMVFLIGALTVLGLGARLVNLRRFPTYVVIGLLVAVGAEAIFDIYAAVIELLGRDPTLTDRTVIWENVLALQDDPILGFGFESFWLDPRLELLYAKNLFPRLTQAHNGYIEIYLHLGIFGVILFFGVIVSAFRRISNELMTNFHIARLKCAWLFAIMLANYTEAQFIALSPSWTIFYIIALVYPMRHAPVTQPLQTTATERSPHPSFIETDRGTSIAYDRPAGNAPTGDPVNERKETFP